MNAPNASATRMSSSTGSSTQHQSRSSSSSSLSHVVPPRPPKRNSSSTDPFLKDFTLVAEAAKRAQMAVLTRDMESWGLS
ncbi:hypothetical protein V8F20_009620 [Naviculisporaceae sp. PSN 640]